MTLANVSQVEAEIKAQGDDATRPASIYGKANVLQNLRDVSARIEEYCQDYFAPYDETRPFDATENNVDKWRNQLLLDRSLLVANEVRVAGNLLTQWDGVTYSDKFSNDFCLYPLERTPANALQGLNPIPSWVSCGWWWNNGQPMLTWIPNECCESFVTWPGYGSLMGAITVQGTWGYRQHYPTQGWKLSTNTVLNNPSLSASGLSITVTDASLFSAGDYLLIGSEYLEIESINTTTDILTVERGVRGSIAAIHLVGAAISVWKAEPNIIRATVRFAAYLYKRAGIFDKAMINAAGSYAVIMPDDIPGEVANILQQYNKSASGTGEMNTAASL